LGIVKEEHLGKGTYGSVNRYMDTETKISIAIKKIKMLENEGIPSTALREMSILNDLTHPNVIKLLNHHINKDFILMAFNYYPCDLKKFLAKYGSNSNFNLEIIKSISFQMLQGLTYLHSNMILHRDLKPANILINPDTLVIQLADFGLARSFYFPIRPFTKEIATMYYRAPEIMLGSKSYSSGTDIWAFGCILAELFCRKPIFTGECEFTQLIGLFR
jgi:serine/threonine protein kinase